MKSIHLTNQQARNFMLKKHGLINEYKFAGKQGILDFISQASCIQYDPIDVCGKNSELVLQSRIKNFDKKWLYELLYNDRKLIDFFDKNLAIIKMSDWPYFEHYREEYRTYGRNRNDVSNVREEIKNIIRERGAVSSNDLNFNDKVSWFWNDSKLSRVALEIMYFTGELVVHHKKGTIKYYDLTENHIPANLLNIPDP